MPTTKSIPGIQRGPDFEREIYEPAQIEKNQKESKLGRKVEANDPVISAAVDAAKEIASNMPNRVDIQFERNSGLIVMTIYDAKGENVIRRIPPEDAIRMAQNQKQERAQMVDSIA